MNNMVAQIESLPELISTQLGVLDQRIRNTFSHNEILSTKKIFITGCGDSYFAGLAAELALKKWTGLSIEVKSSLPAGRYALPYEPKAFPNNPLVIGISVSGFVSRTIEALQIAKETGAYTLALTASPESQLAKTADKMIDLSVPEFVDAPGVRSYQVSLMALYLIGLHFAEVLGTLSMQQADQLRKEMLSAADGISKTVERTKEKTSALAEALKSEPYFQFVGHGPNYATAIFSGAKIVESSGRYGSGQDTEEWAHLEYFNNVTNDVPTFLISPGYRSHDLAAFFANQMKALGRNIIAVTPEDDPTIAPLAAHHLPVVGDIQEALTPLVYMVAPSLFAAYLADASGQAFFRAGDPRYEVEKDHRKTSTISLEDLLLPAFVSKRDSDQEA